MAKSNRALEGGGRVKTKLFVVLTLAVLIVSACGGSDDETNPAAFGVDQKIAQCKDVPVTTPGVTILGQRVGSISNLKVCVDSHTTASTGVALEPQPECGSPCYAVEVQNISASEDVGITVSFNKDGQPAPSINIHPQTVSADQQLENLCVVGVGTPDPCTARVTTPGDLVATGRKAKIKLTWSASTATRGGTVAGYELWRSDTGQEGTFVQLATTTETSFTDAPLTKGQTAHYAVVAYDTVSNHSGPSNVANATAR
jgi:hypothetical protein